MMQSSTSKAYVQAVLDGSTFVTRQGQRIRLARVNAPAAGMPMAELARSKLKALIHKQWVDIKVLAGRGGVFECEVSLAGRSVNDAMIAHL